MSTAVWPWTMNEDSQNRLFANRLRRQGLSTWISRFVNLKSTGFSTTLSLGTKLVVDYTLGMFQALIHFVTVNHQKKFADRMNHENVTP